MTREFSLAHLTALGCPPPEMTYIAAMAGYDYVSIRLIRIGTSGEPVYDLAENKEMMKHTKRALADTGIRILDIELARIVEGVDLNKYQPAMAIAAELGCKHMLSSIWTPDRSYYIEKFGELCDLAKSFSLTVELEFVPIASVFDLAGTVDVLRAVNRENAGILIDMHHFHRSREKIEDLKMLPREWFHMVHLCDAPAEIPTDRTEMTRILREARSYVGEGGIDVANILNEMPEVPYSLEIPNAEKVRELGYAEHARRCLKTAKAYLDAHPLVRPGGN
jgi:sugar phosphate isomerase/epimerase